MPAADYESFSDPAHRAVVEAEKLAREHGHGLVGPEHLLVTVMAADPPVRALLACRGVSPEEVARAYEQWAPRQAPVGRTAGFSPGLRRVVQLATRQARQERSTQVTGLHLLHGIACSEDEVAWRLLATIGVDPDRLVTDPAAGSPGRTTGDEHGGRRGWRRSILGAARTVASAAR